MSFMNTRITTVVPKIWVSFNKYFLDNLESDDRGVIALFIYLDQEEKGVLVQ